MMRPRGFALIELVIAIAVLSMITTLLYGAFSGMKATRDNLQRIDDRYREGRLAMARINRDLQSAYLSAHAPIDESLRAVKTGFRGTRGTPADRVDFNSFSNQRLDEGARVSDQCEISYFGSPDPDKDGVVDLARRIDTHLDLDFEEGGRVDVLATDVDMFELEYLDPMTGQWTETWDTTQATGQLDRLPTQVRVLLVLNQGERASSERARGTLRFITKITIPIQRALTFATQ